ncbi:MAG: hypothetical protein BKP49_10385 [Treponema sp. CETP13]|nr:MAG: hypothetical protein BKP49_10385 [Treponema sp. CETP13]
MTYDEAVEYVENLTLGGYDDWRLPTIKESFSLAMLDGKLDAMDTSNAQPYIDTDYFDFTYDKAKPYTGSYWTSSVCKMPVNNTESSYEEMELPATDPEYFNLSRPDCFVWSSTTCGDFPEMADYIAFGRGYGIDLASASGTQQQEMPEDMQGGMPPKGENGQLPPPPDGSSNMNQPPEMQSESTIDVSTVTISDFVDTHGPGCMRADYKDTESVTTSFENNIQVSQAPALSRAFWESIYGEEYPYPYEEDTFTEFDLSNSENAADYVVIYNYALLVRNAD